MVAADSSATLARMSTISAPGSSSARSTTSIGVSQRIDSAIAVSSNLRSRAYCSTSALADAAQPMQLLDGGLRGGEIRRRLAGAVTNPARHLGDDAFDVGAGARVFRRQAFTHGGGGFSSNTRK